MVIYLARGRILQESFQKVPQQLKTMKPRYFKMDDVFPTYPAPIHARYVLGEYPKIKFYFFKK